MTTTLSDGTPLDDVHPGMFVFVRDGGNLDWRAGYVTRVQAHDVFPTVLVEIGSNPPTPYHVRYVRKVKA